MSRCRPLPREPRRWALPLAVVLLAACGGEADDSPKPPSDRGVAYEAQTTKLPDFRDYVVGELPTPTNVERDPFQDDAGAPAPPRRVDQTPRTAPLEFQLHGIVERQGERVALFGRRSVRVGESIAGWTVREIGPRQVVLERGDRIRRLSL